jgi:hypothetical protein
MICDLIMTGLALRSFQGGAVESPDSSLLRQRLKRRSIIIGLLLLFTLGAIAFDYYDRHYSSRDPIQSVKADTGVVVLWGIVDHREGQPYRVQLVVDGGRILSHNPSFQSDYRLGLLCFRTDKTKDFRDIDRLQKSALYDVGDGAVHIVVTVDDAYVEEWKRGARLTYYFLFLVPKGVGMSDFSTIRQAEALGAIQIAGRLGPP